MVTEKTNFFCYIFGWDAFIYIDDGEFRPNFSIYAKRDPLKKIIIKPTKFSRKYPSVSDVKIDQTIQEVYEKYNAGLQRFLWSKLNSQEDIDDLTQDVYLRLIQHPGLEKLRPTPALLRKIASNLLKDRYRRQKVRESDAHYPIDDRQIASPLESPEQLCLSKEGVDIINKVFMALSEDCRHVFVLHRFKGLTYDEIVEATGLSIHKVRRHISHVLRNVRKELKSYT